jgi:hypothetical protein
LIWLLLEALNDSNRDLTVRENDDRTIFEMIFNYVQNEIEFHDFFRVDRDLRDESQINLFLVHHYENHSRHWRNDYHRECFDLIVDVDVIREYNQMIAFLHDLIVSDYCDFCRACDDDDWWFSSKNHREENLELEFIQISVEDCSVSDFQLL